MALQIDLRIPASATAKEVATFARRAEEAGFDGVGITDMPMVLSDGFVSMAMAAQATSRIRVASAVTNPVTRHVSALASVAQTVAELAPGRVEIWIGRGDSAVYTVGLMPASVNQMREFILTLKSLLAGERVNFNGTFSRLRIGGGIPVPIYVAADGPKAIALAGEVAEGLLLRVALHPKVLETARKHLAEGAVRSGRDPAEIDVIYFANAIIRDDIQEAREIARPHCVRWIMKKAMAQGLRDAGVDLDRLDMPKELMEGRPEAMETLNLYPDLHHAEDWERARQLCAFLPQDILAQICDALGFSGTPEYCAQRLQQAHDSGMDHFYVAAAETYAFPHTELLAFEETIFPAIASIR